MTWLLGTCAFDALVCGYVCAMTHFVCVTWLTGDVTTPHWYVWIPSTHMRLCMCHDSFRVCDMTHWGCAPLIRVGSMHSCEAMYVPWLISYVSRHALICVRLKCAFNVSMRLCTCHDLLRMCVMTHSHVWHDTIICAMTRFICVTWLVRDVTQLDVCASDLLLQHSQVNNCNTLQHTATHCNILQHIATHCNTRFWRALLQCFQVKALQLAATRCNTLQHPTTHCNTLQHRATHLKCSCAIMRCSVLYVAGCTVLQGVAVRCGVCMRYYACIWATLLIHMCDTSRVMWLICMRVVCCSVLI